MQPVSCTNTRHDITDLVTHGMLKNTKTWISWERNIILLWNKKILKLCLKWHVLRSYFFVAEVTFNVESTNHLLPYPLFSIQRNTLLRTIDNIGKTLLTNADLNMVRNLLFGNASLHVATNTFILNATIDYVLSTKGFEESLL